MVSTSKNFNNIISEQTPLKNVKKSKYLDVTITTSVNTEPEITSKLRNGSRFN